MKLLNNIQYKLLVLLALVGLGTSCVDSPEPSASVDQKVLTVSGAGENIAYEISSNSSWTLESDAAWCVPTLKEGVGTQKINIVVEANETANVRTAKLTLSCGGSNTIFSVVQSASTSTLEVAPGSATIDHQAQSMSLAVMSNTKWYAVSSTYMSGGSDWCKIVSGDELGSGNGVIHIACGENATSLDRTAIVTVYAKSENGATNSIVKSVEITQLSQGAPSITLGQSTLSFGVGASSKFVPFVSNITNVTVSSDFAWCKPTVEGNQIKVSVESNETQIDSRVAIVTVSGNVDGEATTAQIVVSQEGANAPAILLLNNSFTAEYDGAMGTINWLNLDGAQITATSLDGWIAVESTSSTALSFVVERSTLSKNRVGHIEIVATNATAQKAFYYVTITQTGVGVPSVTLSPSSLTLSPEAGTGSFTFVINNAEAGWQDLSSSNSWIECGDMTLISSMPNEMAFLVEYTYEANMLDAARSATVSLVAGAGNDVRTYNLSVVQNGRGAPAISTLESVFMLCDQDSHTQSLWMADGDQSGVSYSTLFDSNAAGVTNFTDKWILSAAVDNSGMLTISTAKNTYDEPRTGIVTVIATRGNAKSVKSIEVTQAAHLSAGISAPTQEIALTYVGATDELYPFSILNNSVVEVVSTPSWFTKAEIVTGGMEYSASQYDGGESGPFREGNVVLSANNGHSNTLFYNVKVRQYSPDAAMADVPSVVYLTPEAQSGLDLNIDLKNGAAIESVTSSQSWLTHTFTAGSKDFTYGVKEFKGPEAKRSAILTIKVKNNNANTATYNVTVVQGEPVEAAADVPASITIPYSADGEQKFDILLKSQTSKVESSVVEDGGWLTISAQPVVAGQTATVKYNASKYDGANGARTAKIVVRVSSNNIDSQLYYIDINQGTPAEPQIEAPATTLNNSHLAQAGEFNFSAFANRVKVSSSADWLKIDSSCKSFTGTGNITKKVNFAVELFSNSSEDYREAVITLVAENDNVRDNVTFVHVRQNSQGAALADVPSTVYLTPEAQSGLDLNIDLKNGAAIESVTSSASWLTHTFTAGAKSFTYGAKEFKGPEAKRSAILTIKVKNNNANTATYNVTVVQGEPVEAAADVPASITIPYSADGEQKFDILLKSQTSKVESSVVEDGGWLTISSQPTVAGQTATVKYNASKYDGANGARTAKIVVKVSSNNIDSQLYYIDINQGVPAEPQIEAPATTLNYSHVAQAGEFNFSAFANRVKVSSSADWLKIDSSCKSFAGTGNITKKVNFAVELFSNSSEDYREAVITLVAENDNVRDNVTFVHVRQNSQGAALADVPSTVYLTPEAQSGLDLNIDLKNGAAIESVTSSQNWLTHTFTAGAKSFTYGATTFRGPESERSAILTIKVKNNNADTATYYVTVKQGRIAAVGADVPSSVTIPYSAIGTKSFAIALNNTATDVVSSVAESGGWLSIASQPTISGRTATVSYVVASQNTSGSPRVAKIALEVTGSAVERAVYYVDVIQGITDQDQIVVPHGSIFSWEGGQSSSIGIITDATLFSIKNVTNSAMYKAAPVVTVTTGTIDFVLNQNPSSEPRVSYITLVTNGDRPAMSVVEVIQTGKKVKDAYVDVPFEVAVPEMGNHTIIVKRKSSDIVLASTIVVPADWISLVSPLAATATDEIVFNISAKNSTGERRSVVIATTAMGDNMITRTYYTTVSQEGIIQDRFTDSASSFNTSFGNDQTDASYVIRYISENPDLKMSIQDGENIIESAELVKNTDGVQTLNLKLRNFKEFESAAAIRNASITLSTKGLYPATMTLELMKEPVVFFNPTGYRSATLSRLSTSKVETYNRITKDFEIVNVSTTPATAPVELEIINYNSVKISTLSTESFWGKSEYIDMDVEVRHIKTGLVETYNGLTVIGILRL